MNARRIIGRLTGMARVFLRRTLGMTLVFALFLSVLPLTASAVYADTGGCRAAGEIAGSSISGLSPGWHFDRYPAKPGFDTGDVGGIEIPQGHFGLVTDVDAQMDGGNPVKYCYLLGDAGEVCLKLDGSVDFVRGDVIYYVSTSAGILSASTAVPAATGVRVNGIALYDGTMVNMQAGGLVISFSDNLKIIDVSSPSWSVFDNMPAFVGATITYYTDTSGNAYLILVESPGPLPSAPFVKSLTASNGAATIKLAEKPTIEPAAAFLHLYHNYPEPLEISSFSYDGNVTINITFTPIEKTGPVNTAEIYLEYNDGMQAGSRWSSGFVLEPFSVFATSSSYAVYDVYENRYTYDVYKNGSQMRFSASSNDLFQTPGLYIVMTDSDNFIVNATNSDPSIITFPADTAEITELGGDYIEYNDGAADTVSINSDTRCYSLDGFGWDPPIPLIQPTDQHHYYIRYMLMEPDGIADEIYYDYYYRN